MGERDLVQPHLSVQCSAHGGGERRVQLHLAELGVEAAGALLQAVRHNADHGTGAAHTSQGSNRCQEPAPALL